MGLQNHTALTGPIVMQLQDKTLKR